MLRDHLNCALRDSAEFNRAFRDVVGELLQFLGDFIEQFMQGDEVRPFHIPVRLFRLETQVEDVGARMPLECVGVVARPNDVAAAMVGCFDTPCIERLGTRRRYVTARPYGFWEGAGKRTPSG